MVGRVHRHPLPANHSQVRGRRRRKLYIPLSNLLDPSNRLSFHSHRTHLEGIPHRLFRLRKYPRYLQSRRCQPDLLTRPKSLLSLRSLRRGGHRLAGSPLTQLPMTTTQVTSLLEETLGREAPLSSVSRTSASSGGRAAPKARFPSLLRALARIPPRHPPTTSYLHHPLSPPIHRNLNTHPSLRRELHLVLTPSWTISDLTRIQNTLFISIKLRRTNRLPQGRPQPQDPLRLPRPRRKTKWGA